MTAITASDARANLYRLIDEAANSHKPVLEEQKIVKVLRMWTHYD